MNNIKHCKIRNKPCWGTLNSGESYMIDFVDDNGKGSFSININTNKEIVSWSRHTGSSPTNKTLEYATNIFKEILN